MMVNFNIFSVTTEGAKGRTTISFLVNGIDAVVTSATLAFRARASDRLRDVTCGSATTFGVAVVA